MMFITRSLVAALVIVGTVALSLGASVGLSVLVWQHLLGINLYWVILPLAVILLLAVGSDYNLLLVSRFKEEIHAGINTGIIRSMAGSGSVVTAAGLVFAFTMASFIFSDLLVLGQMVLPNFILNYLAHRMEMAHSIEGRVPFLDHQVAEVAARVRVNMKVEGIREKHVLREAAKDVLIPEVYDRREASVHHASDPYANDPMLVLVMQELFSMA